MNFGNTLFCHARQFQHCLFDSVSHARADEMRLLFESRTLFDAMSKVDDVDIFNALREDQYTVRCELHCSHLSFVLFFIFEIVSAFPLPVGVKVTYQSPLCFGHLRSCVPESACAAHARSSIDSLR